MDRMRQNTANKEHHIAIVSASINTKNAALFANMASPDLPLKPQGIVSPAAKVSVAKRVATTDND